MVVGIMTCAVRHACGDACGMENRPSSDGGGGASDVGGWVFRSFAPELVDGMWFQCGGATSLSLVYHQRPPTAKNFFLRKFTIGRARDITQNNVKMSAIGSLVFCDDCGNLLDSAGGDANAVLSCEVCGAKCKGSSVWHRVFHHASPCLSSISEIPQAAGYSIRHPLSCFSRLPHPMHVTTLPPVSLHPYLHLSLSNYQSHMHYMSTSHASANIRDQDTSSKVIITKSKPTAFPSTLRDKRSDVQTVDEADLQTSAEIDMTCENCGRETVRYYTQQLRGADEGTTVFYTCECGHKYD
jgi:DNA-directed RNA polymerase subunit M/transcription elongation factor TFIIS